MPVADHREAETLRFPREEYATCAQPHTTLELLDGGIDVPERRRHDRQQSPWVSGRPLQQKVIVSRHAEKLELLVVEHQKVLAAETANIGVQHLSPDASAVHVLESFPGVKGAGMNVVVTWRVL